MYTPKQQGKTTRTLPKGEQSPNRWAFVNGEAVRALPFRNQLEDEESAACLHR